MTATPYPPDMPPWFSTARLLIMWGIVVLILVILGACAHRGPATELPKITVVIQPRQAIECYVPALGDPPDEPHYPSAQEEADVMARAMVHRRDYSQMIGYVHELHGVVAAQGMCIERLREQLAEDVGTGTVKP